jgi:hypothetical protein
MHSRVRRRQERRRVLWSVKLEQGSRVSEGEALDISGSGAKVRISEGYEIDSKVVLIIPNLGRFPGEIRWQGDGYVGIAFSEMAIAIEDRLRSRAPPATEAKSSMPDLDVPVIRFENARKGDRTAEHINKRQ